MKRIISTWRWSNLSNNVKILIGAAVIAAAAACVIAMGGLAAAPLAASAANCMATSMLSGAIYGSAIGTAVGAAIGASSYAIQNGTFEGSGQAAIDGASTGFMAGAITGAAAGAMGSGACFVEGTPVLEENGLIPIEKVTAGMMVWSADPETDDVALRHVVQTFVRETGELTHVTISDEEGNAETITCTPEHPFYVEGRGWIGAGALHRGMKVRFASGASGIVKDVLCEELQKPVAVYNFEVEAFHTYFVGGTESLVHNACVAKEIIYSNINEGLNFASSAARHMAEKGRHVPVQILKEVIQNGIAVPDPDGSRAVMYYSRIYISNKLYNIEVLYDSASNTVWHFMYTDKALGVLPKI